jgi:hypothetical protein
MGRFAGWPDDCIEAAFRNNLEAQIEDALEGSVVAQAVLALSDQVREWVGTASELLLKLKIIWDSDAGALPKVPATLGKALDRAIPALRRSGVNVEQFKDGGKKRTRRIRISTIEKLPSVPSVLSDERNGEVSAILQSSHSDSQTLAGSVSPVDPSWPSTTGQGPKRGPTVEVTF